jgi:hypothetical protein
LRWVSDANAGKLIKAVDENKGLSMIERRLESFPESIFDIFDRLALTCEFSSCCDMFKDVFMPDLAIEDLEQQALDKIKRAGGISDICVWCLW